MPETKYRYYILLDENANFKLGNPDSAGQGGFHRYSAQAEAEEAAQKKVEQYGEPVFVLGVVSVFTQKKTVETCRVEGRPVESEDCAYVRT